MGKDKEPDNMDAHTILKFEAENYKWNEALIRVRCETANIREGKKLPLFPEEIEARKLRSQGLA